MRVQKSMKKNFDNAKVVARNVAAKLPESTVRGFDDGRKAGHDFVQSTPYLAGAIVGFTVGATEAVVGALAESFGNLLGWAMGGGSQPESENGVGAEVA